MPCLPAAGDKLKRAAEQRSGVRQRLMPVMFDMQLLQESATDRILTAQADSSPPMPEEAPPPVSPLHRPRQPAGQAMAKALREAREGEGASSDPQASNFFGQLILRATTATPEADGEAPALHPPRRAISACGAVRAGLGCHRRPCWSEGPGGPARSEHPNKRNARLRCVGWLAHIGSRLRARGQRLAVAMPGSMREWHRCCVRADLRRQSSCCAVFSRQMERRSCCWTRGRMTLGRKETGSFQMATPRGRMEPTTGKRRA